MMKDYLFICLDSAYIVSSNSNTQYTYISDIEEISDDIFPSNEYIQQINKQ